MIEILLIGIPLLLLFAATVLSVYLRSTAFKTVIACADAQSARTLPVAPVEGGVVGKPIDLIDPQVSIIVPVRWRDGDACRYCGKVVNWADRKGGKGGTYDHRMPGQ